MRAPRREGNPTQWSHWNNPSHEQLPDLLRNNGDLPPASRRKAATLLRALRESREDADYRPGRTVSKKNALDGIHAASTVLELLEVSDA